MTDFQTMAGALMAHAPALTLAVGTVVAIGVIVVIVMLLWPRRPPPDPVAEQRMADLNARVQAMGQLLAQAQSQLQQTVHERLDAVTARLGDSMRTSTKDTTDHLQQLHARLAVIDSAQKNITDLASQVTSLQNVLANKQTRGAFGQARMEMIIQDGLPKDCYEFQATLTNNARPDCVVHLPDGPSLVIDAKFPLEAVTAFREAKSDDDRKLAMARVRADIARHVGDIAGKYLIPGETQDMALMFVPSESIYAELYDGFDDIFQKAYRAKVIIVSPSLLMLAIQVIQQIRRDARMREAAGKILTEVNLLMGDVNRLSDRVESLDRHFGQVNGDVKQILTSAEKIVSRGERIRDVEFGEEPPSADILPGPGQRKLEAGE
ncbi:MAG TPA: DNA recombination protein RmuC [Pseudolabrys sp.]|nr:DNA recombination protein RmuC [Pseudolabrys sp.]